MSFLKSLFGRREAVPADPAAAKVVKEIEHAGFVIRAAPFAEGGQFQTAGVVEKVIDGTRREHRFIRADRFPSLEAAADHALHKGRQLVDEQGDRLFG